MRMEGVLEQVISEKKRVRVFGRVAGNTFIISGLSQDATARIAKELKLSLKHASPALKVSGAASIFVAVCFGFSHSGPTTERVVL